MADERWPTAVSLSRSQVGETPRHLPSCRDRSETPAGTADVKPLARLILARDTRRDRDRDRAPRRATDTETPARQCVSVSCGVKESEKVAETPAVITGLDPSENQPLTVVSLSQVLGSETPETPCQEPPSATTVAVRGGDDDAVLPAAGQSGGIPTETCRF